MAYLHSRLTLAATLLLCSTVAFALPFSSFDTRSMAMGGAGVAVGSADVAPLFNPALLSVSKESDKFSLILPTIGIRAADPDNLLDSIDKFQSGNYVNNLTNSITTLNNAIAVNDFAAMRAAATTVGATTLPAVSNQLATLSNKPITIDGGAATVVSLPSRKLGFAFYANGVVSTGGLFLYKDKATLDNLALHASCLSTAADATAMDACNTTYGGGSNPNFNTSTLQSGINFRGVTLGEIGFSISRQFTFTNREIALGISPKIIKATLFDVPINVNNSKQINLTGADYTAEYNIMNFDLGAAKIHDNGWRTGLVIKNIIPYTLEFKNAPTPGATPVPNGNTVKISPQARFGISHATSWSTAALDVDLTRNNPAGLEKATQYISLGGELNARSEERRVGKEC